jgi:hypothetical protein
LTGNGAGRYAVFIDAKRGSKTVRDRRILATAKLVYPYVYELRM